MLRKRSVRRLAGVARTRGGENGGPRQAVNTCTYYKWIPSKREALTQRYFNVGPASKTATNIKITLIQRLAFTGLTGGAGWKGDIGPLFIQRWANVLFNMEGRACSPHPCVTSHVLPTPALCTLWRHRGQWLQHHGIGLYSRLRT